MWGGSTGFSSGKSPVSTMGTLDPGQSALAKQLEKMLSGVKSPEDYMSGLTSFLEGKGPNPFGGPLGNEAIDAMKGAMSGKVSEDYFRNTIVNPAMKTFERDIAPKLREESVGPGTYWGGARAENVGRGYSDLADSIAAARGGMANEALARSATSALGYGELMSKGMTDWMNAYAAANPSYTETINSILTYLNTPTQLAYQNPNYIPDAIKKAMQEPKKDYYTGGQFIF